MVNYIELIGYVGFVETKIKDGKPSTRLAIALQRNSKMADGSYVPETNWMNIYYNNEKIIGQIQDMNVQKGDLVRCVGELIVKRSEKTTTVFVAGYQFYRLHRKENSIPSAEEKTETKHNRYTAIPLPPGAENLPPYDDIPF